MQTEVKEYMEKGLAGHIADNGPHDIMTYANALGEPIAFGVFVTKYRPEKSAGTPTAAGMVTGLTGLGVTVRSHSVPMNNGYENQAPMPVMKKGRIWVLVEDAVEAQNAAFVRFVATGTEQLGAFRSDADGTDAVALPNAKFVTDAGAGELAVLDLNLT